MKVEIVAVNVMYYERAKVMGRWPSPPVKFRHGDVRVWFCEWPFFCGKTWHGNKELIHLYLRKELTIKTQIAPF